MPKDSGGSSSRKTKVKKPKRKPNARGQEPTRKPYGTDKGNTDVRRFPDWPDEGGRHKMPR